MHRENTQGELVPIGMMLGVGYSVLPGQRHQLAAIDQSVFVEASTPELNSTNRLEDDAGRGHETEAIRTSANRGRSGVAQE